MRRRTMIAGLTAGLAVSRAASARSEIEQKKMGILWSGPPSDVPSRFQPFFGRLSGLGWMESSNLAVKYRFADGDSSRFPKFASEFVVDEVDLILVAGTPAALAASRATRVIPIVMFNVGDPVGSGLVQSLSRPGGNVTGISSQLAELGGKQISLIRELVPSATRVACLYNPSQPIADEFIKHLDAAASALGLTVQKHAVRGSQQFATGFEKMKLGGSHAVVIMPDPLTLAHRKLLTDLANTNALPAIYPFREHAEAGGLISYGPNYMDMFIKAATYVDKVFRGQHPSELPIEQPTRFELVLNLKTARANGLETPTTLLAIADEVIE